MTRVVWRLITIALVAGTAVLLLAGCGDETSGRPDTRPPTAACPTAAERTYLQELATLLVEIGEASQHLESLLKRPGFMTTPEAKMEATLWAAVIKIASDEILDLEPPSGRVHDLDRVASRMARSWGPAMEAMVQYLDRQSEAKIQEAIGHMATALADTLELRRLRDDICS